MRTCVESNTIALCLKNGSECMADRAFAIRACDMNGAILAMRMAEVLVKEKRAFESFLIRRRPYVLEHRGSIEQILNCFGVIHYKDFRVFKDFRDFKVAFIQTSS